MELVGVELYQVDPFYFTSLIFKLSSAHLTYELNLTN